jgi:predicted RNA-binding protein with TRAM domain/prefoldin subunit 5
MSTSTSQDGPSAHSIRSNLDGLEDLFAFLVMIPEALEEQNARVEELNERINEGLETVEDLERAYELLLQNLQEAEDELEKQQSEVEALREEVDALRDNQDTLRDNQDALRGLFSGRVLDKEDAHVNAQKGEATDIVEVGDTRTVVVDDTNYDDPRDPNAVAHIEGLVTFLSVPERDLAVGDEVEVRIADVGDSHAQAVRIEE